MMKKIFLCLMMSLFLTTLAYAEIPHLINYQGKLSDKENKPLEGTYSVTFRIYDDLNAGNLLWQETQNIVAAKGVFNVLLGSVTNLDLSFDKPYFLEIKVGDEVLSPRQRIASVGYSMRSETADNAKNSDNSQKLNNYLSSTTSAANKIPVMDANGFLPKGSVSSEAVTGVFGVSETKAVNTVYKADTDGFIVGYATPWNDNAQLYVYSDSSSNPTTLIYASGQTHGGGINGYIPVSCPIKKGDYWKVMVSVCRLDRLSWMPVGS